MTPKQFCRLMEVANLDVYGVVNLFSVERSTVDRWRRGSHPPPLSVTLCLQSVATGLPVNKVAQLRDMIGSAEYLKTLISKRKCSG